MTSSTIFRVHRHYEKNEGAVAAPITVTWGWRQDSKIGLQIVVL